MSNSYVGTLGIPTIPEVAEVPQGGTNVEGPPDLLNALANLTPQQVPSEAPGTCAEDPPVLSEKSKDSPGVLPVVIFEKIGRTWLYHFRKKDLE